MFMGLSMSCLISLAVCELLEQSASPDLSSHVRALRMMLLFLPSASSAPWQVMMMRVPKSFCGRSVMKPWGNGQWQWMTSNLCFFVQRRTAMAPSRM